MYDQLLVAQLAQDRRHALEDQADRRRIVRRLRRRAAARRIVRR